MLKIVYDRASLLILDEPTNHLDIKTREVLENALLNYEGTLIAVSHDRYFVNKIVTKEINIPEYCDCISVCEKKEQSNAGDEYRKNKEEKAKIKKAQNQLQKLEKEAEKLCEEIENIDKELVDPAKASDYQGLNELYKNKVELNEKLDEILLTLDSLRDILGE